MQASFKKLISSHRILAKHNDPLTATLGLSGYGKTDRPKPIRFAPLYSYTGPALGRQI
jgi:hypothetical protein